MSVIVMPSNLPVGAPWSIEQRRYDMAETSDSTGDMAVRLLAPPRWALSIVSPEHLSIDDAGAWEALLLQLRGSVNVLAAWDVVRPVPRGSARGDLVLAEPAAAGASTISISGATPASSTLRRGDWLQIGTGFGTSQLIKLVATTTLVAGAGVLTFEAPLRRAYAAGAVVTWDRPLGYYRRPPGGAGASWQYTSRRHMRGFGFDGIEVFA